MAVVNVAPLGCSENLLQLVELQGSAPTQLYMNYRQWAYILEHMSQREDGSWERKPQDAKIGIPPA